MLFLYNTLETEKKTRKNIADMEERSRESKGEFRRPVWNVQSMIHGHFKPDVMNSPAFNEDAAEDEEIDLSSSEKEEKTPNPQYDMLGSIPT